MAAIESLAADTLLTAVSAAFGSTYGVAFPLMDFEPSSPQDVYLDVALLPNGAAFEPFGSGETHQGIMQIAVMHPTALVSGIMAPLRIAEAVADAFDRGSRFLDNGHSVKIPTRPVVAQPIPSDGYVRVPVTIEYHAEKEPT
jgi:hypothetical protein